MSQDRAKILEERTLKRNTFLTAFYDLFTETGQTWQGLATITAKAEMSQGDAREAEDYWEGMGLIKARAFGSEDRPIELLPYGIETIENSIRIAAERERVELERGAAPSTSSSATLPTMDIFVSHATADAPIASALVELLRNAFNLPPDRIRCTSVNGYRLDAGDNINERLKAEVFEARVFIGLITPISAASSFVLFELGARWGAGKPLLPLLAGGAGAGALPGPLSAFHAVKCASDEEVLQFVKNVGVQLGQSPNSPDSYLRRVRELVAQSSQSTKNA